MTAEAPAASVVVSTYQDPDALRLVLAGFARQSSRDFEILVADDGSGPATARLLREARPRLSVPLRHLRQEDRGFRKSRILNRCVMAAEADYLVFTDGDCVPHRTFVASHLEERRPGRHLVGRTVRMSRRFSRSLDEEAVRSGRLDRPDARLLWDAVAGESRKVEYALRPPGRILRRALSSLKGNLSLFGHNFSAWRSDLLRVNGFDEAFTGWGAEDEDLGVRLRNAGVEPRSVTHSAVCFHLWHSRDHTGRDPERVRHLAELRRSGRIRAREGIDGHRDGRGATGGPGQVDREVRTQGRARTERGGA